MPRIWQRSTKGRSNTDFFPKATNVPIPLETLWHFLVVPTHFSAQRRCCINEQKKKKKKKKSGKNYIPRVFCLHLQHDLRSYRRRTAAHQNSLRHGEQQGEEEEKASLRPLGQPCLPQKVNGSKRELQVRFWVSKVARTTACSSLLPLSLSLSLSLTHTHFLRAIFDAQQHQQQLHQQNTSPPPPSRTKHDPPHKPCP